MRMCRKYLAHNAWHEAKPSAVQYAHNQNSETTRRYYDYTPTQLSNNHLCYPLFGIKHDLGRIVAEMMRGLMKNSVV